MAESGLSVIVLGANILFTNIFFANAKDKFI